MSKSKFAVLRIEGDSDEEFKPVPTANGKNGKAAAQKGGKPAQNGGGKLIVHAVERQRPKAKKNNKERVVDPATGYVIQDAGANEDELKKERIRQAVAAQAVVASESKDEESSNGMPDSSAQLDAEIQKLGLARESSDLADFYRSRLVEALDKLESTEEELGKANSRIEHYRDRYRKILELLRDAEVHERAKLVLDLEGTKATVQELTTQLAQVNSQLQQARSRLSLVDKK